MKTFTRRTLLARYMIPSAISGSITCNETTLRPPDAGSIEKANEFSKVDIDEPHLYSPYNATDGERFSHLCFVHAYQKLLASPGFFREIDDVGLAILDERWNGIRGLVIDYVAKEKEATLYFLRFGVEQELAIVREWSPVSLPGSNQPNWYFLKVEKQSLDKAILFEIKRQLEGTKAIDANLVRSMQSAAEWGLHFLFVSRVDSTAPHGSIRTLSGTIPGTLNPFFRSSSITKEVKLSGNAKKLEVGWHHLFDASGLTQKADLLGVFERVIAARTSTQP